jgi:hypothetical protein
MLPFVCLLFLVCFGLLCRRLFVCLQFIFYIWLLRYRYILVCLSSVFSLFQATIMYLILFALWDKLHLKCFTYNNHSIYLNIIIINVISCHSMEQRQERTRSIDIKQQTSITVVSAHAYFIKYLSHNQTAELLCIYLVVWSKYSIRLTNSYL